jgi:cysteine desulfurase
LETAREHVAACFGARPRSVIFTSGATEAIASATWGATRREPGRAHVVLSAVEHSAARLAATMGDHTIVGVDGEGRVDPAAVRGALRGDTALVHVQLANHEVGTLQPVAEVIDACRGTGVLVHVDAAAANGHVPIDFTELGADLLSISSHKLGGPVGVGALLVRRGLRIPPLLTGGDQERARRAGLENVPAIAGFAAACASLDAGTLEREATTALRQTHAVVAAFTTLDGVTQYGPADSWSRLPHLVCFGVADVEPQAVLLGLDRAGVAAHSGSACASASLEPSPVLEAMGIDAHHSLRLSVGWSTTDEDVTAAIEAFPRVLAELRALRG